MNREKGAHTAVCPNCGSDLEVIANPDGSLSAEACTTCYGTAPAAPSAPLPEAPVVLNPPSSTVPDGEDEQNDQGAVNPDN